MVFAEEKDNGKRRRGREILTDSVRFGFSGIQQKKIAGLHDECFLPLFHPLYPKKHALWFF